MWVCQKCRHRNDPGTDQCVRCATSQDGEHDPVLARILRWRRRLIQIGIGIPLLYVPSYFLLGSHSTGYDMNGSQGTAREYTWHDRGFPFDPWIYRPLARVEYWWRGPRSSVVIYDNRYRGGEPTYSFGPFR